MMPDYVKCYRCSAVFAECYIFPDIKLLIIFLIIFPLNVFASDSCFYDASVLYGVRQDILEAIAITESNKNQYALNIDGKSHFPTTKQSSMALITEAAAAGHNFDIGIMQINKFWFKKTGYPYEAGLDECFSIKLGAWVLALEMSRSNDFWTAIGRYHSPNMKRGHEYMWRVYNNYQALFGKEGE